MKIKLTVVAVLTILWGVVIGYGLYSSSASDELKIVKAPATPSSIVQRYFELAQKDAQLSEFPTSKEVYSVELFNQLSDWELQFRDGDRVIEIRSLERLVNRSPIENTQIQEESVSQDKAKVIAQVFLTQGEKYRVGFKLAKNLSGWKINDVFLIGEKSSQEPRA